MNAFGVHGCTAITALTAQNTLGVQSTQPVSEILLRTQLESLMDDLPPTAIKTGMLGTSANVRILAEFLESLAAPRPALICDPVLKSTSGTQLLDPEALDILLKQILPHVTVLTPNLPEVETLTGKKNQIIEAAAEQLLNTGIQSVMIKGGHADGDTCLDYWTDGSDSLWLTSPRLETKATHGTGCILASAIAAGLALSHPLRDAVVNAKTFLNQCLRSPAGVGKGPGPMKITRFMNNPVDRPAVQ